MKYVFVFGENLIIAIVEIPQRTPEQYAPAPNVIINNNINELRATHKTTSA